MPELLVELLSEEIPARMQPRAAADFKRLVCEELKKAQLAFERAESFATPRRLALVVHGLPLSQKDTETVKKGPRTNAPDKAIRGFVKSIGIKENDLENAISEICNLQLDERYLAQINDDSRKIAEVWVRKRAIKKDVFFTVQIRHKGRPTSHVLDERLWNAILEMSSRWPKAMRWADGDIRWVRPLHNVLAVFDENILELALHQKGHTVTFTHEFQSFKDTYSPELVEKRRILLANNQTRGHRFLAPDRFTVTDFADYRRKLREAHVILDSNERKQIIAKRAKELAEKEGLRFEPDEALLAENAGLVEWPVVLIGGFDEAFLDLPREVLITSMTGHQKYFPLFTPDGALAPRFVVVANVEADDGGAAIVAGNERVLRARLYDAKFFWDQDRETKLVDRVGALKGIIFHEKLGDMLRKVERIQTLAAEIGALIPNCDPEQARRAALLCKADLTTDMVGEFPELQGVMGRYYALQDGETPDVAEAVAEHYAPLGPRDRCPTAPVSIAVALADKIDTLFGLFAIGERPTGSKDPFALRRAALGVIRLILENELRLPLRGIFRQADMLHAEAPEGVDWERDEVIDGLLEFFADRLKVHLRESGLRHDLVGAVFAVAGEDDLLRLVARADALKGFVDSEAGADLLTAYGRAANIVRIEEKKDGVSYDGGAEPDLLAADEERMLYARLGDVDAAIGRALAAEDFTAAMAALASLRDPVDRFFDRVTVNCDEPDLRRNRLRLLARIRDSLKSVADFSLIEG